MSMWVTGISLVVAAAGATVTYVGQQKAADAAEDAGKAQQKAAEANAHNQELQSAEAVRRERINKSRRLARLRSQMNAGGVVMSDSSMDVFAETAGNEELAIQDAARASNLSASNTRSAGDMAYWEAKAQATATRVSSYGTLLSSASSTATTYKTTQS